MVVREKTFCSVFVFVFVAVFPICARFIFAASYCMLVSCLYMLKTEIDLFSYLVIGFSKHLKNKKKKEAHTISSQLHTSRSTTKHKTASIYRNPRRMVYATVSGYIDFALCSVHTLVSHH